MIILHIETSTNVCSVAVSKDEELIFERMDNQGLNHAKLLSPFIQEALDTLKSKSLELDAVSISEGPGSYTGLRIGVSTSKGLCYGYNIPLIAVSTLELLAQSVILSNEVTDNQLLCPMIDARRMEVYTALYDKKMNINEEIEAKIIDENSYQDKLITNQILFFGNGADKCKDTIQHTNARFLDDVVPLARNMIKLANQKYLNKEFVDTAYFEPFYLKEFQATTPKKLF